MPGREPVACEIDGYQHTVVRKWSGPLLRVSAIEGPLRREERRVTAGGAGGRGRHRAVLEGKGRRPGGGGGISLATTRARSLEAPPSRPPSQGTI